MVVGYFDFLGFRFGSVRAAIKTKVSHFVQQILYPKTLTLGRAVLNI
jgi:hypothetical protein